MRIYLTVDMEGLAGVAYPHHGDALFRTFLCVFRLAASATV